MKPELLGDNPFLPQPPPTPASGVKFSTWMGQMPGQLTWTGGRLPQGCQGKCCHSGAETGPSSLQRWRR